MTRIPYLIALLYDLRALVVLVAVAGLLALVFVGRCVVAVAQDIAGGARRLWE